MQTYDWLSQGENIIFESAASKVWNVKGINLGGNKGGKLILTDKQLVFQAYAFNIGTRLDKIPLENITGTAKTFNPLVPNPNMIKVETRLGEKFEFTFWKKDKEKWLEIIPKAVSEFKSRQGNTINAQRVSCNAPIHIHKIQLIRMCILILFLAFSLHLYSTNGAVP